MTHKSSSSFLKAAEQQVSSFHETPFSAVCVPGKGPGKRSRPHRSPERDDVRFRGAILVLLYNIIPKKVCRLELPALY